MRSTRRAFILAAMGAGIGSQACRLVRPVACEVRLGAIIRGRTNRRRLALVFTGHEFAEGGGAILNALNLHRARGSFFLTGDFLRNPDHRGLVEQMIAQGHYVGPHSDKHLLYCTWDASRRTLVPRQEFQNDLEQNDREIAAFYGRGADRHRPGRPRGRLLLPPYEHYNEEIVRWARELGWTLINFTPGTRSNADYTGEADKNFVHSGTIFDSIMSREKADPHGLSGFLLLLHLGAGPAREDKFHQHFEGLLRALKGRGYKFVRADELLADC